MKAVAHYMKRIVHWAEMRILKPAHCRGERSRLTRYVHTIIGPTTIRLPVSILRSLFLFSHSIVFFWLSLSSTALYDEITPSPIIYFMPISNMCKWTNYDARKSRRIMWMSGAAKLWKSAAHARIIENGHTKWKNALFGLRQRFAHISIRTSFGMFTSIQSM